MREVPFPETSGKPVVRAGLVSRLRKHALAVIRVKGSGVVWIDGTRARCGFHICSFSARTVRSMAEQGLLVRAEGSPETYRISEQEAADAPKGS